MILGPYLTPHQVSSKSIEEFFPEYCSQTNKQTGVKTVTSIHLRWRRLKRQQTNIGTSVAREDWCQSVLADALINRWKQQNVGRGM